MFNPEQAIKVSADDVTKLRRMDVFRVLDWTPPEHRQAVADHINDNREDLKKEVEEVIVALSEESK